MLRPKANIRAFERIIFGMTVEKSL